MNSANESAIAADNNSAGGKKPCKYRVVSQSAPLTAPDGQRVIIQEIAPTKVLVNSAISDDKGKKGKKANEAKAEKKVGEAKAKKRSKESCSKSVSAAPSKETSWHDFVPSACAKSKHSDETNEEFEVIELESDEEVQVLTQKNKTTEVESKSLKTKRVIPKEPVASSGLKDLVTKLSNFNQYDTRESLVGCEDDKGKTFENVEKVTECCDCDRLRELASEIDSQSLPSLDSYRQWHEFAAGNCLHREQTKMRQYLYKKAHRCRQPGPEKEPGASASQQATFVRCSHEEKRFGVLPYPMEQLRVQYIACRHIHQNWTTASFTPENLPRTQMSILDTVFQTSMIFLGSSETFATLGDNDQAVLKRYILSESCVIRAAMGARMVPEAGDLAGTGSQEMTSDAIISDLFDAGGQFMPIPVSEMMTAMRSAAAVPNILQCAKAIMRFWPRDDILAALSHGVLYYNPDRPGLADRGRVWRNQSLFYDLVKRYFSALYRSDRDRHMAFLLYVEILSRVRGAGRKLHDVTANLDYLHLSPTLERLFREN